MIVGLPYKFFFSQAKGGCPRKHRLTSPREAVHLLHISGLGAVVSYLGRFSLDGSFRSRRFLHASTDEICRRLVNDGPDVSSRRTARMAASRSKKQESRPGQ